MDNLVGYYCPNPECGNWTDLPPETDRPHCSGCGSEMRVWCGSCPKCSGAGGPPAGKECLHEDVCDYCDGTGVWPEGKPCPDGMHVWTGKQMGGPPDMAESYEWVGYCDVCGIEGPED